jgi:hypothetical protein
MPEDGWQMAQSDRTMTISRLTSHIDVAPTVLDLLGIRARNPNLERGSREKKNILLRECNVRSRRLGVVLEGVGNAIAQAMLKSQISVRTPWRAQKQPT